jgi:hypothetical protein
MKQRIRAALLSSLVAILLGQTAVYGQAKTRPDELSAIVEKAIQAHGGQEVLAGLKAQVWKDKGVSYFGGKKRSFTGSYAFQVSDQMKMEMVGESPFSLYFNRDKGWANGKALTAAQIQQQQEGAYVGWVTTRFPLRDKSLALTLVAETLVNERPATGVRISSKGHHDIEIYFDKESGLMAKTVTRAFGERESLFSAYKSFDGIPVPMKYVIKQDGQTLIEGEFTEWRRADSLDERTFSPPH